MARAFSSLQLFEYVADCLADFMKTKGLTHKKLPLGLTFSFPCAQTKLEEVRPVVRREEAARLESVRVGNRNDQQQFSGLFFLFYFLTDEVEM